MWLLFRKLGGKIGLLIILTSDHTNNIFKKTLKQYRYCENMSIQHLVLGFEPMTSWIWVSSHNHYTRAPAWSMIKFWVSYLHEMSLSRLRLFAIQVFFILSLWGRYTKECHIHNFLTNGCIREKFQGYGLLWNRK